MLSPPELHARCHGPPSKPSFSERWHHAGKPQILLILLRGRQSCAPSAQHALHHPGQCSALPPSNTSAEQVPAKALLPAKLEKRPATASEAPLASGCSAGRLLLSGWSRSAQRWGDHKCIFVVTRVGRRIWRSKKENLGTALVTRMLSGVCLGFQGNFFLIELMKLGLTPARKRSPRTESFSQGSAVGRQHRSQGGDGGELSRTQAC